MPPLCMAPDNRLKVFPLYIFLLPVTPKKVSDMMAEYLAFLACAWMLATHEANHQGLYHKDLQDHHLLLL